MSGSAPSNVRAPDPRIWRLRRLFYFAGIALSVTLCTCAGCCILVSFIIRAEVVETPEGAVKVAERITDWTLPPHFGGKSGLTAASSLLPIRAIATFEQEKGRGVLVLGQMNSDLWSFKGHQEFADEFIGRSSDLKSIELSSRRTIRKKIRDRPAKFEIGRGEDRASTTKYCQVTGHFRGKSDDAMVVLQCEDELLTDEQIDEFVNSIK